jgi:hypothetical protein
MSQIEKMSKDEKEERKFQFALAKVQMDFEFWFALAIGVLAIGYGMLGFFKDNLIGLILCNVLIVAALVFILKAHHEKEERFKEIKKKYIDTQSPKPPEPMAVKKSP